MLFLINRWSFLCCISLSMFEESQSIFLRHTQTGKCIAAKNPLPKVDHSTRYWAKMVGNCLHVYAQFRYNGELLKNIKKGGTFVSNGSEEYENRFFVYKEMQGIFENSIEHSLKQTSGGSLFLYKKNICAQPSENYVVEKESPCSDSLTRKFTFGSVTDFNTKMENVHCSSKQLMMVKKAYYGNFNNSGKFNNDKGIDKKCSSLTTCSLKNLCGGRRSCALTVDSNLLLPYCSFHSSKELYTEYTCLDEYNSVITEAPKVKLSLSPNKGFIEIKSDLNWRIVNDEKWDKVRQKMFCQHLGFKETEINDVRKKLLESGHNRIATGDLICYNTHPVETSCCVHLEPSKTTSKSIKIPFVTCKICDHQQLLKDGGVFSGHGGTSSNYEQARFNENGWCSSGSGTEYLLIDLRKEYQITRVLTLGNKDQTKWSGSYVLKYSHTSHDNTWDQRSQINIKGNQNGYQASHNTIRDIYNVRYIRIESTDRNVFCLRIELCGKVQLPGSIEHINQRTSNTSVHLSWEIPGPQTSSYITHFIVKIFLYINGEKLVERNISRKSYGNEFSIPGLKPNTWCRVGIETQDGSFQKSQIVHKFYFKTKEGVPRGPPKNVRFISRRKNSLKISWEAPDSQLLNGDLTGYKICYSTQENDKHPPRYGKCLTIRSTKTRVSRILYHLLLSTRYFVTVAAGTSAGYGKKSDEISEKTIGVPRGPPKNVRFISRTKNSLKISWEAPDSQLLNGDLTGYKICYSTQENDKHPPRYGKCLTIRSTKTRVSRTIYYLLSSTKYFVTVAAGTSAGFGKKSDEISEKTIEVPSGSPNNLRFTYRRKTMLGLSWKVPDAHLLNGKLEGYKICYSTQENDKHPSIYGKCFQIKDTRLSYTIRNLHPFTKYFVTVAAGTSAGYGKKSDEINRTTFPTGEFENPVANSYSSLRINITKQANIKEVMIIVQTALTTGYPTSTEHIDPRWLKPYPANKPNPYYVAAYLKTDDLPSMFVIGDGIEYNFKSKNYFNQPLQQNTNYIVFLRFLESQNSFYSTKWSKSVRTMIKPPAPNISEPISTGPKTYQISWSQSLPGQQTVLKYLVSCSFPGGSGEVSSLTEEKKSITVDYNKRYSFGIQVETEAGKSEKISKSWWTHSAPLEPKKTMDGYTVKLKKPIMEDQNITTVALVIIQLQSISSIPRSPEVIKIEKSPPADNETNKVAFIASEFNITDFTGDFVEIFLRESKDNQRKKKETIEVYKLRSNVTYRVAQMNTDESGNRIWSYWSEPLTNGKGKICDKPLLQDVSTFPDSVFSGSGGDSNYKDARFSNDGWCSSGSTPHYLLIDLQKEYHITRVLTMGNRDQTKLSGSYSLKYRHNETLVDQSSAVKITGNKNGYQASATSLDIYNVRYIKIEWTPNIDICFRIELCGEVQLPATVKNLFIKPSNFSVHLSWTIPNSKNSSYITHFIIYLDGNERDTISRKNQFTIPGLKPNTRYFVGIVAKDSNSEKSRELSNQFKTKEAVPSEPPLDVTFTSRRKDSLDVSWKAIDERLRNGVLTGYQVCISTKNNDRECFITKHTKFTFHNLRHSTKHFVNVSAGTKVGYGKKSLEISKITNGDPINPISVSYYSMVLKIPKPAEYVKCVMVIVKIATSNLIPREDIKTIDLKQSKPSIFEDPYVTAYLKADLLPLIFVIGDGKEYNSENEKYFNKPLKEDSSYIVFLRFFESQDSYYSTEWSSRVKTMVKPSVEKFDDHTSDIRLDLITPLIIVSFCFLLLLGVNVYFHTRQRRRLQKHNNNKKIVISREANIEDTLDDIQEHADNNKSNECTLTAQEHLNRNDDTIYESCDDVVGRYNSTRSRPETSASEEPSAYYMSLNDNEEIVTFYQPLVKPLDITSDPHHTYEMIDQSNQGKEYAIPAEVKKTTL